MTETSVELGRTAGRRSQLRRIAVVPAYNEESSIVSVVAEIRGADPGMHVVVVDDGSLDRTPGLARLAGAIVLELPFNLGIGGAVQAGYRYALENGFDVAVQIDGDGQHDPADLPLLLAPLAADEADLVVGTRFAGRGSYRPSLGRRIGIRVFAGLVSLIVRERVTDTTSGFRAVNRRGIELFALHYPHDYPEVESTALACRNGLRMAEVAVHMRDRAGGRSSITPVRSVYYVVKVSLALAVGLFRRPLVTREKP